MIEPSCTWSGQLPAKKHCNPTYSCKVFLGGVPWDITECKYNTLGHEWFHQYEKTSQFPAFTYSCNINGMRLDMTTDIKQKHFYSLKPFTVPHTVCPKLVPITVYSKQWAPTYAV